MALLTIRVKRKRLMGYRLLAAGLIMMILVVLLDMRLRPVITVLSRTKARQLATEQINSAVEQVLAEEDMGYGSVVAVTRAPDGDVKGLSANRVTINRVKTAISDRINENLLRLETQTLPIPIGTLMGGQILSGKGPALPFHVTPLGSVQTEVYNEFETAGINQTVHRIMVSVRVEVTSVLSVYTVNTPVETNVVIAQNIVVGQVPDTYTDINGDMSDLLDMYNNYAN